MTEMIAIDRAALDHVIDRLKRLEQKLDAAQIATPPRWITVQDYAARVGRSVSTVRRHIRAGKIETQAGLCLNPDAPQYPARSRGNRC